MRLRRPPRPVPTWNQTEDFIKSYQVELITPLYGGGVQAGIPDDEMPVRAASIRGQLRYWWRMLNQSKITERSKLFLAERNIFGGFNKKGGAKSSLVDIWISDVANIQKDSCADYRSGLGTGYALFPSQSNPESAVFATGLSFSLNISICSSSNQEIEDAWNNDLLPALRWWASLGGIGARTRRGLGSIKIENLEPVTEQEATAAGCQLRLLDLEETTPNTAWNKALEKLQIFRQGPGVGRDHGKGKIPGRSRWPEADSIREITGCRYKPKGDINPSVHPAGKAFPRGIFGLPIIIQFKQHNKGGLPADREPNTTALYPVLEGKRKDRMASPLILKAMWTGKRYAPVALLLPHGHVATMGLKLEDGSDARSPGMPCTMSAGKWWSADSANRMVESAMDNPLKGKTGNVLNDFLDRYSRR